MGKIIAQNKKAFHDYFILDTYEAGIVLTGTEIKSIRKGSVNLKDAFARIKNYEVYIHNMHISPYEQGNQFNHDPLRHRKLLLNKKEILKMSQKINEEGHTLVPLKIYLENGFAKIQIGIAKGKKNYDKRQTLKEKDAKRQIEKSIKYKQH